MVGGLRGAYPRRTNKFAARATVYGGERYASRGEAEYARTLDLRQHAGFIKAWARAETLVLIPGNAKWRVTYTADFRVWDHAGASWLVEFKGAETEAYRIRLKVLKHLHPELRLLVVRADGSETWAW